MKRDEGLINAEKSLASSYRTLKAELVNKLVLL